MIILEGIVQLDDEWMMIKSVEHVLLYGYVFDFFFLDDVTLVEDLYCILSARSRLCGIDDGRVASFT